MDTIIWWGSSYFTCNWHPGYLRYLQFFVKKFFLSFFIPCSSNSSRFSFGICFALFLSWYLISVLSLRYFSSSQNTLGNIMDEMSLFCIVCEMIPAVLCNLLWACSLIVLCFSCFAVNVLTNFCVIAGIREKSGLVLLNTTPTGRQTPLENLAMKNNNSSNNFLCFRLTSITLVILSNRFTFFASLLRTPIWSSTYALILVNFFKQYICGSCGAIGFRSG